MEVELKLLYHRTKYKRWKLSIVLRPLLLAVALPSETQVHSVKFLSTTRGSSPGSFLTVLLFRSKWVWETYSTLAVAKNILVYFIGQCFFVFNEVIKRNKL